MARCFLAHVCEMGEKIASHSSRSSSVRRSRANDVEARISSSGNVKQGEEADATNVRARRPSRPSLVDVRIAAEASERATGGREANDHSVLPSRATTYEAGQALNGRV